MKTWPTTRLRYVAALNPSIRTDLLSAPETEVSFLPMEAIGEDGSLRLDRNRPVSEVRNGYTYFEDGDVVFAKVTPCFENGKGALMRNLQCGAGFGTSELTVLRPRPGTNASFLNYVLQSEPFRRLGVGAMTGAGGLKRVPDDFTRDFVVAWPDAAVQAFVANFLDEQTTHIDALIAEKERLAIAVREYEQAQISQLLAQGLSNAALAETGNIYVPAAPSHWRVVPFKRALQGMEQGWSPQCDSRPAIGSEWGVLKVGCVNGTRFNPEENKVLPASLAPDLSCVIRRGDVLVSRANTRELVGSAALVWGDFPNLLLCDKLYRLKLASDWVTPEFAVLLLRADTARRQIELGASGASSSMQNISQDVIRELVVALPPLDEQAQIVEMAKAVRVRADDLASHVDEHISRLREYRASLISAAVTGQLDINSYKEAA
jgi:type I restriction enzyme S subunit